MDIQRPESCCGIELLRGSCGDCSVSFDQSCLASSYNRRVVKRDHAQREEGINAIVKAQKEKAIKEAEEEEKRVSKAIEE